MKLLARGQRIKQDGVAETLGEYAVKKQIELPEDIDELDDALSAEEYELYADQVVDQATAAETIPELEAEILILRTWSTRHSASCSRATTRNGRSSPTCCRTARDVHGRR